MMPVKTVIIGPHPKTSGISPFGLEGKYEAKKKNCLSALG
jgi:hypothetical protein